MEYSCGNCKYMTDAEKGYVGKSCTRILHVCDNRVPESKNVYIAGDSMEITLIVQSDFLCKLWEPIEE